MSLPMIVAVRGYAVPVREDSPPSAGTGRKWNRKVLPRPSQYRLVFDCETTSDHAQSLRFGTYQCRKGNEVIGQGIFYEPDNLTALSKRDLAVIVRYAKEHSLTLRTRQNFVDEVFYRYGYWYRAAIIGFNLPFDISRLATKIATSHGRDMRNAFSFTLSPMAKFPNVLIRHLNARASFMRFAAVGQMDGRSARKRKSKMQSRRGFFQDAKTLAAALMGKGHTLKSLADALGTEHRKMEADEHGAAITPQYLDYAMKDTQVTWECYEKLAAIYDSHGLTETPAHRIYSEASLGKGYLNQMGIIPPRKAQPDVPPEVIGQIMGTYYGGRSEVKIRRQITRILYCDFRSMYPTVCTLMGLWQFVIAAGFDSMDWTTEAQALLAKVDLGALQNKDTWRQLTVLVQIAPEDDVLPVRAAYDGKSRTIGLNHLSAEFPMWFTLADCIASKLVTGRSPRVVQAIRYVAREPQTNLKPIALGDGFTIDPLNGDFFRELIVMRGRVQSAQKVAGDSQEADRLDALQMMLKLLANSTSYGIYAEQNVQSHDRPRAIELYGQERAFRTASKSIEEPGSHFHPLVATLITGAARLMLACAERVAADQGLGWAFCDTDSLALARPDGMSDAEFLARCKNVTGWFDRLEPYGDGKPLFKVEDQNYSLTPGGRLTGKHRELFTIAISAKRYVLFNVDSKRRPIIRKALAHGLGHLMEPYSEKDAPTSIPRPVQSLAVMDIKRWQYDLWYRIVLAFFDGHPDEIDYSELPGLKSPARSRYGANTAALRNWFKRFNEGKPLHQQVKSFNFLIAYQTSKPGFAAAIAGGDMDDDALADGLPAVVAPYSDDPMESLKNCFDRRTGKRVPLSILKSYLEAVADYASHPESKFENGDTLAGGMTARRHVQAVAMEYLGKEANRWEEQFYLGELPEAQIEYGISNAGTVRAIDAVTASCPELGQAAIAAEAGISRQALAAAQALRSVPRLRTLRGLITALVRKQQ